MSNLTLKETAVRDLSELLQYISVDLCNPTAAKKLHTEIMETFNRICMFPKSAPLVNYAIPRQLGIRKQVVKNFCIFYSYDKDTDNVVILYVQYAARDFDKLKLD